MAGVTRASTGQSGVQPPVGQSPAPAGKFHIPEDETAHLPVALKVFEEMVTDPPHLCCPVGLNLFNDPVIDSSGHTYDRKAIVTHYSQQKEKRIPLTTPLSGEAVDSDAVLPNKAVKSSVEEYKTTNARQCFELAKQCIARNCGQSALILINRAKILSPQIDGLAAIEEAARDTFISIQKKKEAYIQRAEKALGENQAAEALMWLKSLEQPATYTFSHSKEPALVIKKVLYSIFFENYLVVCRPDEEYYQYEVYDIDGYKCIISHQVPFKAIPEAVSISGKEAIVIIFNPRGFLFFNLNTRKSCLYGDTDEPLNDAIDGSKKVPSCVLSPVPGSNKTTRVLGWIAWRRYNNAEDSIVKALLIYPSGETKLISLLLSSAAGSEKRPLMNDKFYQDHFPEFAKTSFQKTDSDAWSRGWLPQRLEQNGLKKEAEIIEPGKGGFCHHLALLSSDKGIKIHLIHPIYTPQTENVTLYTLLFKVAVIQNDFESYLHAIEHLVGNHHHAVTWRVLEDLTRSFEGQSKPIQDRLTQEIKKAEKAGAIYWASRFYLFLGLFQSPLSLKLKTYKKALTLYPGDPLLQTAVEEVTTLLLEQSEHGSVTAEGVSQEAFMQLQGQVQQQQQQIEKLQGLIQDLLGRVEKSDG